MVKISVNYLKTPYIEIDNVSRYPFDGLPSPFQKTDYRSSMPYIMCNEHGQEATLEKLKAPSAITKEKRVHLGFSVWFNYEVIATTDPGYAIICDIDSHVMEIYEAFQSIICNSNDRTQFVDNFQKYVIENREKYFSLENPSDVLMLFDASKELTRSSSWLYSEKKFQTVKELHHIGRVLYLNLDITSAEGFGQIKQWLDINSLKLDTLYASNIFEWLGEYHSEIRYFDNLRSVASVDTRYIHAYRGQRSETLDQHVSVGV